MEEGGEDKNRETKIRYETDPSRDDPSGNLKIISHLPSPFPLLPAPRAILFDWDGTLVDTWKAIIAAYNITRIAMGMDPWDETTARHNIRKSWRDAFPEVFGDRWEEAGKIYKEQYGALSKDHIEPIRGAFELLDEIKQLGLYCGVVSNKSGPFLREEVKYFNWGQHFGAVVGAGDAKRDKPHADPIYMALDGSSITAGPEVWFVGDTGMDMEAAHAAGCTPLLVNGFNLRQGELSDWPPAAEFDELFTLAEALRKALQSGKSVKTPTAAGQRE